MAEPAHTPLQTNPHHVVAAYLLLVSALSSAFWYIIAVKPQFAIGTGILRHSMFLLMWCPVFLLLGPDRSFTQEFHPAVTATTGAGRAMPGEFGRLRGAYQHRPRAHFPAPPVYAPEDAETGRRAVGRNCTFFGVSSRQGPGIQRDARAERFGWREI